jgi:hypothetical protein
MMLTEVYVSFDNENFNKLDLDSDQPIPMKYIQKDTQDLSKIYSPYSQNFSFSATPRNQRALDFFGKTESRKTLNDKLFFCKVYANNLLSFTGFLKITDVIEKNGKLDMYSGNFTTLMSNLKDRIGEDTINNLSDVPVEMDWLPNTVYSRLQSVSTTAGIKHFIPLASTNRVLGFDASPTSALLDNVAYNAGNDPASNKTIKSNELRPAIQLPSVMSLIKTKYNLDIIEPFTETDNYKDLFIWCTGEELIGSGEKLVVLQGQVFVDARNVVGGSFPNPNKYAINYNVTDSSIKVVRQTSFSISYDPFITLRVKFENITYLSNSESKSAELKIYRKGTNELIASGQFEDNNNTIDCVLQLSDNAFISNELEFYINVKFSQPTIWANCYTEVFFKFFESVFKYATFVTKLPTNNNSSLVNASRIDLIKSLPVIKVIDFVTSYLKMFNISIYESSPDSERLYWLNPQNIEEDNQVYSKATIDYTAYVDLSSVKKSVPNDFNYYNFKHKTSKYRSNVDYLKGAGQEYGQLTYPQIKPNKPIEYKIETEFTIIPPVLLSGTSNIPTFYGFNSDSPSVLSTGEQRYKPNFGELTLFYSHGVESLGANSLSFQMSAAGNTPMNGQLTNFIKCLPFARVSNQSLAFSILVFQNIQYPINLYSQFYSQQTVRFLDVNVLKHEIEVMFPASELYLNEASTIQGQGNIPQGFRLQNDIVIKEMKYSVLEALIDRATGKGKLTLLNYT